MEIKIIHEFNNKVDTLLALGFVVDCNYALINIKNKNILPVFTQLKKLGIKTFEVTL